MNPLYGMGNNQMLERFRKFKQSFSGDPRQKVQELLNSGQMSQSQFNQLQQMAQQFKNILK